MTTPEAWNIHPYLDELLGDIEKFFSKPFEGDTVSEDSNSGTRHCDVFENWSSWRKGRGLKGGINYNERAGLSNNGNQYLSPYGAQYGVQLPRGEKTAVSNNQGSDVTQPKYILPTTNPNALKHLATSVAPSTIEGHILQFPVFPPSQFRNCYSRPPLTPTCSQNNIQAQIDSIVAASMTSSVRSEMGYCCQCIHPGVWAH
ncbi:hypothetical protein O988_02710 [Pseudogymnoascus sp. VKM F-3808]|nr:hypothetical protein O988_02710 [Pseudogymnoascus sp. VKM F-3808]